MPKKLKSAAAKAREIFMQFVHEFMITRRGDLYSYKAVALNPFSDWGTF